MIKINLLKDIGGGVGGIAGDGGGGDMGMAGLGSEGPDNKDAVVKIVIALFPVLLVYGYEQFVLNEKDNKIASIRKKVAGMKTEVNNLQPAIRAVKSFQEEKKKLEIQVEAIKELSIERLLNVKALDTLQSVIPKTVWLSELTVNDKQVIIKGGATSDIVISDFMSSLNRSIYFSNTILIKTSEKKTKDGVSKEFEIQSQLAVGS